MGCFEAILTRLYFNRDIINQKDANQDLIIIENITKINKGNVMSVVT